MTTRFIVLLTILMGFILCAGWLSLTQLSTLALNTHTALKVLSGNTPHTAIGLVMTELRLPRFIGALLCGAALAGAGLIMQAITANPIASPSIFGITSGANLGFVLAVLNPLWPAWLPEQIAAIILAALCWFIVMRLGNVHKNTGSMIQLVLVGAAISTFCAAITKTLLIFFESTSHSLLSQMAGNLAGLRWPDIIPLMAILVPLLILTQCICNKLNLIRLGHQQAQNIGLNTNRWLLIFSSIVLVSVSTVISYCGQFAFVGLVVPHISRLFIGHDHRVSFPITCLLGATLIAWSDVLGRASNFPAETPAGAVIALIGAPIFLYLVRRKS
ncbi:FecCD family ABC transporter permease [Celerinatantimonas sp. YJH-8]|uniref:FecCD family ABC transporter permease n=1 Tax=Celerinatantimonas sp. YJH-8 TaxID=3228714 RepID=UPI0038BE9893